MQGGRGRALRAGKIVDFTGFQPAGRVAKTPLSGYNTSYFLNALSAPESAALTVRNSSPARRLLCPVQGNGSVVTLEAVKARRARPIVPERFIRWKLLIATTSTSKTRCAARISTTPCRSSSGARCPTRATASSPSGDPSQALRDARTYNESFYLPSNTSSSGHRRYV